MTIPTRVPGEGYHDLAEDGYYNLPPCPQERRRTCCPVSRPVLIVGGILILLVGLIVTAGFVFWPTSPHMEVKQWKLNGISIDSKESESILPAYQLNVSLEFLVEIVNPNYAGVVYDTVTVRIVYRGTEIGEVESEGSRVEARSAANLTATANLEGNEIIENVKDLVVDVSKRELPLTTYTTVNGALQIWFFKPLIQVVVACDLVVDPKDKVVLSQECGF